MRFLRWLRATYIRYAPGAGSMLPWIGAALLLLAGAAAAQSWAAHSTAQRVTATITENIAQMTPHDGVLYHPRFRFRTPDGTLVQVVAKEGTDEPEFPAGNDVPVQYPAADPGQAVIATVWRVYWVAILLGVFGVILFDIGLILRILLRRQAAA
jgi:hypothetical protein